MTATTGYQAGIETTNTLLSYGVESVWGTAPASQFQAIRYTGETLAGQKDRQRPSEINASSEVSQAVTVRESAGGQINFALSYGTFDDFFSGALRNDWGAAVTITGAAGDIVLTAGAPAVLSSATANKFSAVVAGQYIKLIGFTNAANNGVWYVSAKTDSTHISIVSVLGKTAVTETPTGSAAKVRGGMLANGSMFKSLYVQQKFSPSMFLVYPGSFASGLTLQGGVGQSPSGSVTLLSQLEQSATTDASTGAVLAAPTGPVHDAVSGFLGVAWNNTLLPAVIDSFSVQVQAQGASQEWAMGSAAAQGMLMGLLQVTGSLKMFFKDFTYYANFKNETTGRLSFITSDANGNTYVVTLLNAALMNPTVEASGPGQPVYATFQIEGNPQAAGGTIQIDRLAGS